MKASLGNAGPLHVETGSHIFLVSSDTKPHFNPFITLAISQEAMRSKAVKIDDRWIFDDY